jgi:hypothetical protein
MELEEMGYEDADWVHLPQDRDQWRVPDKKIMKFRVP